MNRRLAIIFAPLACTGLLLGSCVTERFTAPQGLASFRVEVTALSDFLRKPGCENAPMGGSVACPRPFAEDTTPVSLRITATALGSDRQPISWNGSAQIDVRPGKLTGVGPSGFQLRFVDGVAEPFDVSLVHGVGATRIWIEDCGSQAETGTFATGVSEAMIFEAPRIDQLNATIDNTTSPMTPRADNVCAVSGDPRYGYGPNEDGVIDWVGYSHGKTVNAPPPPIGNFIEITGCTRDTYDKGGDYCERGPIVVTGIGNDGFYVTDLQPEAVARGFNSMFVFNFNYPDNLEVGDIVTKLRGSPMEFAGTTQLRNPSWTRDGRKLGADRIPAPVKIDAALYGQALRTYGRNNNEPDAAGTYLALEKLEGAVVCMDNLAPGIDLINCDTNDSGRIERTGCLVDTNLPPTCCTIEEEQAGTRPCWGPAPTPPSCGAESVRNVCMPLSPDEVEACGLTGYLPAAPAEYCCERTCYTSFDCIEESGFVGFGQWTADVEGRYEPVGSPATPPVKIAVISRNADPDRDALAFGREQRALPAANRKHYRVIGNLRHVLAARPVWVIIARTPSDIGVMEDDGGCP